MDFISSLVEQDFYDKQDSIRGALISAKVKANKRFSSFLKSADESEFEQKMQLVQPDLQNIVDETAAQYLLTAEQTEQLSDQVQSSLKSANEFGEEQNYQVPPEEFDSVMELHQNASPEAQDKLRTLYQKTFAPELATESSVNSDNEYVDHYLKMFAKDEDTRCDDDEGEGGKAKGKTCPTCHAAPGEPCRKLSDEDVGGDKVHETRKKGHGEGGKPIMKLLHTDDNFAIMAKDLGFIVRAAEDGDTYVQERVEVSDGTGDPGSPKIDRNKVPEGGLDPIDVPSNAHPLEQQPVSQVADYSTDTMDELVSETGKLVDVDTPMQPEDISQADQGHGVFPNKNQADPVTSKTADLQSTEMGGVPRASDPWDPNTDLSHPAFEAMKALQEHGFSPEEAQRFVDQYMNDKYFRDEDRAKEGEKDPYGMSQGLGQEDMRSMHMEGKTAQWDDSQGSVMDEASQTVQSLVEKGMSRDDAMAYVTRLMQEKSPMQTTAKWRVI